MKLGLHTQIITCVPNLQNSLSFFSQLGFKLVSLNETAPIWGLITDGKISIVINQTNNQYTGLAYYSTNVDERVQFFEQRGIRFDQKQHQENTIIQATLWGFNDIGISLIHQDPEIMYKPQGNSFAHCGTFGEFSLPTKNLSRDIGFWRNFEFETIWKSDVPNPWAVIGDEYMTIGLHQSEFIEQPALTYYAPDMTYRILALKEIGLNMHFEIKDEHGTIQHAGCESPGGLMVNLFSDA